MHGAHASSGSGTVDVLLIILAAGVSAAYAGAALASRRRGRRWPLHRIALWIAGIAAGLASVVGPLAAAAHDSFQAHMVGHLLAGMIAPILLVLAAPVTLALRTLPVTPARRLSRVLSSVPARVVTHPITALVLSTGGLWLIYMTPVLGMMRDSMMVHVVVHAHMLLAGYVFIAALIGLDPRPHPTPRALLACVLVVSVAAHGVLAKMLYANPPGEFAGSDVRAGAQLMYYAGAWVEAAVIIVFCAQWYRAADPVRRTRGRRLQGDRPPSPGRRERLSLNPPRT